MKAHHKAALITAGIFGAIGIGLCTAAMVIGISSGDLYADINRLRNRVEDAGENLQEERAVNSHITEDGVEQNFSDVSVLKIDLNYAGMEIVTGTGDEVHVTIPEEADGKVRCRQKGDTLEISDKRKGIFSLFDSDENSAVIYLVIPENIRFEVTEINVGTGDLTIESLNTKDLVMDCGVGEIDFSGSIAGNADIDCGVGTICMDLAQSEKDFNYEIDCGVGSASIGGMDFLEGMGAERSVDNNADQMMSIDCGVGDIEINFTK